MKLKVPILFTLFLSATAVAFAQVVDPSTATFLPLDREVVLQTPIDDETAFAAPSNGVALIVFTYEDEGYCPHCDAVRDEVKRLERYYPVIYAYRGTPLGDRAAVDFGVQWYPTFVLCDITDDGAEEIRRWSGEGPTFRTAAKAFDDAGYRPPGRPRPAPKTPPRPPRPVPPKPKPRPVPRDNPQPQDPPRPKPWFVRFADLFR